MQTRAKLEAFTRITTTQMRERVAAVREKFVGDPKTNPQTRDALIDALILEFKLEPFTAAVVRMTICSALGML